MQNIVRELAGSGKLFALCCTTLSLSHAALLTLDGSLMKQLGATGTVQISDSLCSCALLLAVAAAFTWRPQLIRLRWLLAFYLASAGAGLLCALISRSGDMGVLLFAASALLTSSGCLSSLLARAGCVVVGEKLIAPCVVGSFLLGHVWNWLFSFLNTSGQAAACLAVSLAVMLAACLYCRPLFDRLQQSEPPAALNATRPSAFLPFGSQLFVYVAVFNFAHGYLLSFASTASSGPGTTATVIGLVAIGCIWMRFGSIFPDTLFSCSLLLVVGGFLLAPIAEVHSDIAAALLAVGVACFNLVYLYTLLVIGAKNKVNTIPLLAWGACVEVAALGLGQMTGTAVHTVFAAAPGAVSMVSAAIVLAILASVLFTLRSFSFEKTIRNTEDEATLTLAARAEQWQERCDAIADAAGLTPREREVFALLAKGRNSPFIQKELVITNNTVKVHVRHIYQKLGVAGHQELIDLVDND